MVLACLAACHKDKEMDVKEAVVSNEEMTVSETQARFSWQVEFAGQFQTGVEVSQSENMVDLRRVEASKEEDKFVAVVDSLTEGTNYYYRFVVWNKFGSSAQSVGNFKTMETPPAPGQDTTYFEITVSVNLPESGTATGGGRFAEGDTCTVTATANEGYNFVNWTENDIPVDTNSVYSFAVNSDRELVANFSEESAVLYTVNAKAEPEEGGTVTGGGTYEEGREIELKATANTGYAFDRWNDGSTDNPRTVTVTADVTYTAYFTLEEYEIKVECQPENGGTATGGGTFHYGDTIALNATPNANFNFEGWSDGSTDNPYEVVVTGNATYKAVFSEAGAVYYNVATHVYPGDYAGTVTGGGPHPEGSQIQLSANANTEAGYLFEKWDDGNTDNPRTITVNSNMEFTAYFKKKTYTVTVQAGTGGAAHIGDMSGTIEATFEHGESCTVHALPETGYSFVNWTENGSEASTDDNYSFIVTSNHNLVANFQQQQYWIGTSVEPTNSGTVSGGNRYYNHGEQCNLTATANEQYEFDHWTKNGSSYPGGTSISFTVTEAASYTAHFRLKQYTITVSASTGGSAHVGSPTGPITGTYTNGQQCTVYAVANTNYTFTNWTEVESGNVASTEANYTFTVTGNRNLRANFNYTPPQTYTITVSANPSNGGTAHVGSPTGPTTGTFTQGQSCTIYATANEHYTFTNWKKGNSVVSTNATYTFDVTESATYTAYFTQDPQYTITATANPTNGGTVTGGGTYYAGTTVNLTANANSGFTFGHWQDGNTNNPRTITVTGNATYTAYFEAQPQVPTGAIPGKFTIDGDGNKVYFSQGNLHYIGSSQTWKFADHQWEVIGTSQGNTSQTTTRDLFGWGTSGYNHGAVCYQPWSTSQTNSDYYAYGDYQYNLYDQTGQADWGYNPISNGGGQAGQWRTLTEDEWVYVFQGRSGASSKYGHGKVNGQKGMILLPDEWTLPSGMSFTPGNSSWVNEYTTGQWEQMEQNGAVFLPAAGGRGGTSVSDVGSFGYYWSASYNDCDSAYFVLFGDSYLNPQRDNNRYYGFSVRLVRVAQ